MLIPFRPNMVTDLTRYQLPFATQRAFWLWTLGWLICGGLLSTLITLSYRDGFYSGSSTQYFYAIMAILLGLVALFYLDYAALRSGYRQMSLSNTTPTEQVHITHQVSRLRVWRAMMLLVGWRVGAVLMLSNMIATTEFIARFAGKTSPTPSVLQSGILLVLGVGLALYYISEPIWRARLVTAFGMSAALEQRQRGTFAGSALGTSGARWVLGYGIVSFSLLLIGLLVAEAARYGLTSQQQIAIVWIGLIASFLVAGSVYYTLLPGQWLKRVAQGQSEGNPTPMPDALRDGFWDNVFPWMGTHRALPLSHPLMQGHVGAASAVGLGSIVRRWLPFYGALGFVGLGLVTAQANIPNTLRDFPFPINDGYDSVFSAVIKGSSVIVQAFFGIGILSVLGSLLLDLIVIAVGANVINQSRNSERGDLLRMTGQPESAMLYAEHTRVKQHARFGLRLVFGLRLLSAFAFGALAADIMYETLLSWVGQPSYVTLMVLGLWGFLVIYSLEPVWHYHAITSVGLAVASLGRSIFNGWVMGFGAVLAIWLIQAAITIGFTAVLITLLNSIPIPVSLGLGDPYNNIAYNIIIFGILFIGCMLTGVIICGFYALLARFSLRYAAQRAFGE